MQTYYGNIRLDFYFNFGVSIGFKNRQNSVGNFQPNSDESLYFVGIRSEITDGMSTKFILDLQSYYKCITG